MKRSELRPPKVILNLRHEAEESARLARLDLVESGLPAILLSIHAKKFDDEPFQNLLNHIGQCCNDYGKSFMECVDEYWRHCEFLRTHEKDIFDFDAVLTAAEESGKLAASDNAEGLVDRSGNLEDDKAPGFVLDSARLSVADVGNPLAASDTL